MKMLAFSGMHQDLNLLDIFLTSIERKDLSPDVFISAGDIGDEIHYEVFNKLSKLEKPIVFVGGNWELDPKVLKKTAEIPNVYHISEENLVLGDYIFIGQDAWTNFTDGIDIDEKRYQDLLAKVESINPSQVVLVTHHAPLGILDRGYEYPTRSMKDTYGNMRGGSQAIRNFIEVYNPRFHIFAHLHSDGAKWVFDEKTLFANVCHLSRKTREGISGRNGSFMMINSEEMNCIPHHMNTVTPQVCACGSFHFLNYRKCVNCYDDGRGMLNRQELEKLEPPI
jgi:Icc-related predicted phosphoesterase